MKPKHHGTFLWNKSQFTATPGLQSTTKWDVLVVNNWKPISKLNYLIKGWPEIRPIWWSASWCDMWGWDGGVRNIIRPMTSPGSPQGPSGSRGTQLFPREMAPSLQLAPKLERMHPYGKFDWFQIWKSLSPLGTAKSHITQQMPEGIRHSTCLCFVKTGQARPDYQEWGQDGAQIWLHPLRGRHLSPGGLWPLPCQLLSNQKSCEAQAIWMNLQKELWTSRVTVECSLERLMLKLKLKYFGHLVWTADSLEKTLMLGKTEGRKRRGDRGWDGRMASLAQWTSVWANSRR